MKVLGWGWLTLAFSMFPHWPPATRKGQGITAGQALAQS